MKMHHTVDQGVLIDRWDQMLCIIKIKFLATVINVGDFGTEMHQ